ncbi:unnamed protein product [Vitrella brassicaformis CCMP3155]|uniref:Uncharacterized protein n=1 Tax=Vitrella brassicaformis (strain CCMP3155) TaxID=1169540 RepID=A0A0G4G2A9_VITBC|nr:unnamed protein product [Vitrella brassicaformis CCMP3155]|eukprot:CEM21968.1 unnamed protein product [Vitrella brassicaformis CCMP3155]
MLFALFLTLALCVTCSHAFREPTNTPQVRRQQDLPANTKLSASEYDGLIGLLGNHSRLTSLYRASEHGGRFDDMLKRVGDKKRLAFVLRTHNHQNKNNYVFGFYMSESINVPPYPANSTAYESEVWWFSLAGHFRVPVKIVDWRPPYVRLQGEPVENVGFVWSIYLDHKPEPDATLEGYLVLNQQWAPDTRPKDDIRNGRINLVPEYLPPGYFGMLYYFDGKPSRMMVKRSHSRRNRPSPSRSRASRNRPSRIRSQAKAPLCPMAVQHPRNSAVLTVCVLTQWHAREARGGSGEG